MCFRGQMRPFTGLFTCFLRLKPSLKDDFPLYLTAAQGAQGALVLPLTIAGIKLASATRRFATPLTLALGSPRWS